MSPRVKLTPAQAGLAVEVVVPAAGVPEQATGGVKVYILPEPGHAVFELLAVVVLVACVVVVIL